MFSCFQIFKVILTVSQRNIVTHTEHSKTCKKFKGQMPLLSMSMQTDYCAIGVNPEGLGVATPRFWAGGCGGRRVGRKRGRGVVDGSENIITSYHVAYR